MSGLAIQVQYFTTWTRVLDIFLRGYAQTATRVNTASTGNLSSLIRSSVISWKTWWFSGTHCHVTSRKATGLLRVYNLSWACGAFLYYQSNMFNVHSRCSVLVDIVLMMNNKNEDDSMQTMPWFSQLQEDTLFIYFFFT